MQKVSIVYWEEEGGWLGYIQEYPDYWTQGDSLEDLKDHLKELSEDLTCQKPAGFISDATRN